MRLLRFLPVIGIMALLFFLSSLPGNTLVMPKILSFDKLLHAFAYGVLAAAALFAVPVELRHEEFSAALQAECFFAHPYQAWERGLNENTNGLIRQYLPKGTDFDMLSQQDINLIMDNLNNRPRKSLGFNTPKKLFLGACQKVALGT